MSPSNYQIFGVYFYFIFHFSFWKLCSLAMLPSSGHQKRFPPNKFIGINMALGLSWINYLYTMRWSWWWMQRSWGDHLFKYGGTLISTHWRHLTTTKGAPYCLLSKTYKLALHIEEALFKLFGDLKNETQNPLLLIKDMLDKNYSETFFGWNNLDWAR